jgi:glycerol kinase
MSFYLAIDQGTTGTTAVLIDANTFSFVDKVNEEFRQIYPKPGWVEHNLNEIWQSVESTIEKVLKKANVSGEQILGIGITNQRETTCAFSRDGLPLANAIVWQDRRTSKYCKKLKDSGQEATVKKISGLPIDPYFSATKMRWLLENNEQVIDSQKTEQLLFGTIDSFLLYKLTNHQHHKTESSNASRTLLMNLETCDWENDLLSIFNIDKKTLPEICDSFSNFGETKGLSFLPDGVPISGVLGDQQAALFGQAGTTKGDLKCTYGTGAFMLLNTGPKIVHSDSGLLTTVAYSHKGQAVYALEGSCYIAGAAVQWLRDNLNLIKSSAEVETLASQVKNLDEMENLLFLPFFTGLGSPYWVADAQAAILGITRDTQNSHIARSCLDGIALSINDLIGAMNNDTKLELKSLKVDGGAVANDLLLTIQASVSQLEIIRPRIIETTAYGAGLAAALGQGKITLDQMQELWKEDKVFRPEKNWRDFYQRKSKQWKSAIEKIFL